MFYCDDKAQGQSLKELGIDLREECFSQQQFHVARSEVGSVKGLHMLALTGNIPNVYKDVLCTIFIITYDMALRRQ
jgi:hypothetical protein